MTLRKMTLREKIASMPTEQIVEALLFVGGVNPTPEQQIVRARLLDAFEDRLGEHGQSLMCKIIDRALE